LLGNPSKAKTELGWGLRTKFAELVQERSPPTLELAEKDALTTTKLILKRLPMGDVAGIGRR